MWDIPNIKAHVQSHRYAHFQGGQIWQDDENTLATLDTKKEGDLRVKLSP
jgi:hypothetical protein